MHLRTVHPVQNNGPTAVAVDLEEIAYLDEALAVMDALRSNAVRDPRFGFDKPWPLFIRYMRALTPQAYGARVQNRLAEFFRWTVVSAKLDRGDVRDGAGEYHEVKVTFITASNPGANFVQIRPHQDIAGYHLFVVQADYSLVHLWLSKADMDAELQSLGRSAHGTKTAVVGNSTREFAVRFPWTPGTGIAARWLATYQQHGQLPA